MKNLTRMLMSGIASAVLATACLNADAQELSDIRPPELKLPPQAKPKPQAKPPLKKIRYRTDHTPDTKAVVMDEALTDMLKGLNVTNVRYSTIASGRPAYLKEMLMVKGDFKRDRNKGFSFDLSGIHPGDTMHAEDITRFSLTEKQRTGCRVTSLLNRDDDDALQIVGPPGLGLRDAPYWRSAQLDSLQAPQAVRDYVQAVTEITQGKLKPGAVLEEVKTGFQPAPKQPSAPNPQGRILKSPLY